MRVASERSIPVLVVAFSDHSHFMNREAKFEKYPLTISENTRAKTRIRDSNNTKFSIANSDHKRS
jgi:hypothetical protein